MAPKRSSQDVEEPEQEEVPSQSSGDYERTETASDRSHDDESDDGDYQIKYRKGEEEEESEEEEQQVELSRVRASKPRKRKQPETVKKPTKATKKQKKEIEETPKKKKKKKLTTKKLIGGKMEECLSKVFEGNNGVNIGDWNSLFYSLHPGGPGILDRVEQKLGLKEGKLRATRHVLSEFGNMGAPSVFFILDEMRKKSLEEGKATTGEGFEWGVLVGIRPRLTVETVVLRSAPTTAI